MNKLATVIVVIFVAIVGIGWFFLSNLDRIVASTIEAEGSRALGTEVRVRDVSIQLSDGTASIGGLTVANPEGYQHPYAFELNEISVEIDYDTLDITRIHVRNPVIVAEAVGLNNNFSDIIENMPEPQAGSDASGGGTTGSAGVDGGDSTTGGEAAEPPPELTIHRIEIDEATAILESDMLDAPGEFVMDSVVIEDVTGTPDQVARQVSGELLGAVSTQVLIEVAKAQAGEELQRASEKASELLRGLLE